LSSGTSLAEREAVKTFIALALVANAPRARAAPDYEGGVALGGVLGAYGTPLIGVGVGAEVMLGGRIGDRVWLRGSLGAVSLADVEDSGNGPVTTLRIGLDYHACSSSGAVCVTSGLAVGGFRARWSNFDDPVEDHGEVIGALVSPHVAFDAGGDLRFRAALDTDISIGRRTVATGTHTVGNYNVTPSIGAIVRF
jgi:hypothetical protein